MVGLDGDVDGSGGFFFIEGGEGVCEVAGVTAGDAVVCLQHNPDGVEFLKPFPWQYMLCGHTHGGQADFPIVGPMYVPTGSTREYLKGVV